MRLVTARRNGALDIAIVTGDLPLLENQGMPLWSERILLALLKEHPLASKDVVTGPTSATRRFCSVNMILAASLRIF
jgi:DNA-binding transcriptional LysR family regulator